LGIPEIEEEMRLRALDELDLLYVAFTRPEQRLYAGVDGKSKDHLSSGLREHFQLTPGSEAIIGTRAAALVKPEEPRHGKDLRGRIDGGSRDLAIRREAPEEWDP